MVRQLDLDFTKNKHGGNSESVAANETNLKSRDRQKKTIFEYIKQCGDIGATSHELVIALDIPLQTVSARCSELKASGAVFKRGTRKSVNGCPAGVLIAI